MILSYFLKFIFSLSSCSSTAFFRLSSHHPIPLLLSLSLSLHSSLTSVLSFFKSLFLTNLSGWFFFLFRNFQRAKLNDLSTMKSSHLLRTPACFISKHSSHVKYVAFISLSFLFSFLISSVPYSVCEPLIYLCIFQAYSCSSATKNTS